MENLSIKNNRLLFIDYFRAFLICLVVVDHSLHAYSAHYGQFWFLPDFERDQFFDILHLHNDSFMMPSLFFISGLFVLPSLERRGYSSFFQERLIKLGIPFILGILFICPLLSYPRYKEYSDPFITLSDYIKSEYFSTYLQAGPFWFLYYLGLLIFITMFLHRFFPFFLKMMTVYCQWVLRHPVSGTGSIFLIASIIMGGSDLIWGAPWWIGFGKIFYIRASRFLLKAFLFFLGIGFRQCREFQSQEIWKRLQPYWKQWGGAALIIGTVYMAYSLGYFEQAYNNEFRLYLKKGADWQAAGVVFQEYAPFVLIRTTLLTAFILSQLIAYLLLFYTFLNHSSKIWLSLVSTSYGIYIIHEPFVVWIQWFFHGKEYANIVKFLSVSLISLGASWMIVKYILLRFKIFKKIL